MPILPDRIQQILYGDTIQPFLYGERIAQTLIQRTKLPILSILVNHSAILPVQASTVTPIVYVFGESTNLGNLKSDNTQQNDGSALQPVHEISEELSASLRGFGIDNTRLRTRSSSLDEMPTIPPVPGFDSRIWREIRIRNRLIAVPQTKETDWEQLVGEITKRAQTIDLLEPFVRISLALDEAKNAA